MGMMSPAQASVAQLDRVLPSEGRGRGFESRRVHQIWNEKASGREIWGFFVRLVGGERVLSRVGIVEVKINPLFSPPFSQAVFQLYDHYDFTALSAGLKQRRNAYTGTSALISVPPSARLRAVMVPPWAWQIARAMDKPSPLPPE